MKIKKTIVFCLSLLSFQAMASSGVGLVCFNQNVPTQVDQVTLLDFAEGAELHNDQLQDDPSKTEEQHVADIIAKLNKKSPYLGQMLEVKIKEVTKPEILRVGSFSLDLTGEIGMKYRICADENQDTIAHQVAHFTDDPYTKQLKEIRADKKYFSKMSPMNRAGLLIHEALYSIYRIHYNHKNSNTVRRLTSLLFSNASLEAGELKTLTDGLLNGLFLTPIVNFENDVLKAWGSAETFDKAEANFKRTLNLPFGIVYKTQLSREKLPPFQVMVMGREGAREFVNDRVALGLRPIDALGVTVLGPPAAWFGAGIVMVFVNLGSLIFAQAPASIAVMTTVPLVAGGVVAVVGITALTTTTVNHIKFKRAKNYLFEAFACTKTQNDCIGKEFKHLEKIYNEFIIDHPEHDDVDLKEYAKRVVDLAYENKFFNAKAGKYIIRKKMQKVVSESFN